MNTTATLKFFDRKKGFGFFKRKEGQDIFVHAAVVETSGFDMKKMKPGVSAVLTYQANGDKKSVTHISELDGLKAQKMKSPPSQPCRVKEQQSKRTLTAPKTLRRVVVDKNEQGDKLIKVSLHGSLTHFEIEKANDAGTIILHGVYRLEEARQRIGKTIVHPSAKGFGKKTNIPGLGPAKGRSDPPPVRLKNPGGKKAKKAA